MEENRSYGDIIANAQVPYINSLAQGGAVFSSSFGVVRGSQPNYLAIFSGSTQGVVGDTHYPKFNGPDLYSQLRSAGKTFAGYFQSMPSVGFDGDTAGEYARKHNPVTQFVD